MASWPPAAPFWPSYSQGFEYPPDSSSQADKPLEESAREWAEWSQKYAEWYKEYYGVEMPVGDWSSNYAYTASGTQQQAESHLTAPTESPVAVKSSTSVTVSAKDIRPADSSTSANVTSITLPAVTSATTTSMGNTLNAAVETKLSTGEFCKLLMDVVGIYTVLLSCKIMLLLERCCFYVLLLTKHI